MPPTRSGILLKGGLCNESEQRFLCSIYDAFYLAHRQVKFFRQWLKTDPIYQPALQYFSISFIMYVLTDQVLDLAVGVVYHYRLTLTLVRLRTPFDLPFFFLRFRFFTITVAIDYSSIITNIICATAVFTVNRNVFINIFVLIPYIQPSHITGGGTGGTAAGPDQP